MVVRSDPKTEQAARFVYDAMMWAYLTNGGKKLPWIEGGTSWAQDVARQAARKIIAFECDK